MRITFIFVYLVMLNLAFAVHAEEKERNLVLNRPYTYCPVPEYSHCTDEGDAVQITDGFTNYKGTSIWMNKPTVGWVPGLDEPVIVQFDFGEDATLSELHFNTVVSLGVDIAEVGLRVYASLDDQNYMLAGELPVPPPSADKTTHGVRKVVPLGKIRARYVAVAAMAPPPYYVVFADEIEVIGTIPADSKSNSPIEVSFQASGAKGLHDVLSGKNRNTNLMLNFTAPVANQIASWPEEITAPQREDVKTFRQNIEAGTDSYDNLRSQFAERHRIRARQVYNTDTLVWEVIPDDNFGMLSLPEKLSPLQYAEIHTVVNALEATGLGVANLTDKKLPLKITVTGGKEGSPKITPRVARFFVTTNAMYVPDALLATDSPQTIPSGESMLVWLSAESTGAKPGNYNYQVALSVGNKVHTIPLEIHVHNVVLSTKTPLSTLNWSYIDTDEYPNLNLSKLRNSMLEHRITVGGIHPGTVPFPKKDKEGNVLRPVQLDFSRMDRMLEFHKDFPKIGFYMPFDHPGYIYDYTGNAKWMSEQFKDICREFVKAVIEHIKASGRDYDSFYLQFFDETVDEKVSDFYRFIRSIDPEVHMMLTIPQASADGTKEIVKAGTNIFNYHATPLMSEGEYDNVPDGFPILSYGGRELWFYGAADSKTGAGKERDPLNLYRLMHWVAFKHGATGVGFWNMFRNTPRDSTGGWGDENIYDSYWPFVYVITDEYPVPADVKTSEKFIPSRRWEYARMGIEDYMLLKMAQERIASLGDAGNSWQSEFEKILGTVLTTRAKDRNLFRAKRRELVELIEKLPSSK